MNRGGAYSWSVPKLWTQTIEGHRREVRDAILQSTSALVAERGLRAVTMSEIADAAGIGRATLYKYFPDVESILGEWHEVQISDHLAHLAHVRGRGSGPLERLEAVLSAYGAILHESGRHHHADVAALLHRDERVPRARRQLHEMIRDLIADAANGGEVREDVSPDELAAYCLHALGGAATLRSRAAVRRLVAVTVAGLRA